MLLEGTVLKVLPFPKHYIYSLINFIDSLWECISKLKSLPTTLSLNLFLSFRLSFKPDLSTNISVTLLANFQLFSFRTFQTKVYVDQALI